MKDANGVVGVRSERGDCIGEQVAVPRIDGAKPRHHTGIFHTRWLVGHRADFFFHFRDVYHYDGVPRAAI